MNSELKSLLKELEDFGNLNDKSIQDRQQKMLNITHDTGVFLSVMVQSKCARRILEIGTSNGYSTLWLAAAAENTKGSVTTVEWQEHKAAKAKTNFEMAKLSHLIHQIQGDAGHFIKSVPSAAYEFIFLDSDREQYADWWQDLSRLLTPGGLLVVDNATSHAHELLRFRQIVDSSDYENILLPVGKGELVILKPL